MTRGVIAGNFDVLHPGYIQMFNSAFSLSDHLTVLLHAYPTLERPEKLKPILSVSERTSMLLSLRAVDEVLVYNTEKELHQLLAEGCYDVRFLGEDYQGKEFTGSDLNIWIHWISRDHGWSTTKYKTLIADSLKNI